MGGRIYIHDRKFFYARYIDWILTTPLMLWDILALAGAPSSEIMLTCGIDMLMIGFGVVGGATPGYKKWIFWVLACLCFMHVVGVLMKYMSTDRYGAAAKKLYGQVAWLTMVLDVLSKCMFGFVIVSSRSALGSVSMQANKDE